MLYRRVRRARRILSRNKTLLGIIIIIFTVILFSIQDGLSKYMAQRYDVVTIVMIRMWFMLMCVVGWGMTRQEGVAGVIRTKHPVLQISRGVLLNVQICVLIYSFTAIGLAESLAVFSCYPLLVVVLSIPILGEKVGWQRWSAVLVGFSGVMLIIQPGSDVFSITSFIPLISALMFATYYVLTRYVVREDSAMTSFFWIGVTGSVLFTLVIPFFWTPIAAVHWPLMALLCVFSVLGHFLVIKALEFAEATTLQPFTFLQLVFGSAIGIIIFDEVIRTEMPIGAAIVVASGLFTIWRESRARAKLRPTRAKA